jgi:hypothetical protein
LIKRLLDDDPETLAMFEEAIRERTQGTRTDLASNATKVKDRVLTAARSISPPSADRGIAYILRRLSKDRPDLFERDRNGET